MRTQTPIVLAAGGTGGHMFPAEALAGELVRRGHHVLLATDRRGARFGGVLGELGRLQVDAATPSGRPDRLALALLRLARGYLQARRALRRERAAVAVGFGGYASVPTVLAAEHLGLPCLVHEQNAHCGRANRLLAKRAAMLATGFPQVAGVDLPESRIVHTGNPVRAAVLERAGAPYERPAPEGEFRILVTGGSQGARAFSELLPEAIALLPAPTRARLRLTQQCRAEDLERVRARYAELGVTAELSDFFTEIPALLAGAHLVVARSGASTVAELVTVGRPAILIPYPYATDDHQTANARVLDEVGASFLTPQAELTPPRLAELLGGLIADPDRLAAAAAAAHGLARPDAVQRLADAVAALVPHTPDLEAAA
jgi:UDP-N-acetylglucosamine--N-acetylmuramyl-(pentapeptide) pyrophosphoryl-undecaprenol N-acetylglucosamine transferase